VVADEGEESISHRKPRACELMCGENAPLSRALSWCGWDVEGYDWAIHSSHDLTRKELQDDCIRRAEADEVDLWAVGLDCSTLTRARERPIPGHPKPPAPLRSAAHPEGLPSLDKTSADWKRVQITNRLIEFVGKLFRAARKAGKLLENPAGSWLWQFRIIRVRGWSVAAGTDY